MRFFFFLFIIVTTETLNNLVNFRSHTFFPPYLFLKNIFIKHSIHETKLRQVKIRSIEPIYDAPHPISPFFNSTLFDIYYMKTDIGMRAGRV